MDLIEALELPIPENTHLGLLDDALSELERVDPQLARIVELRYFMGLTVASIARIMNVDKRTVYRQWAFARGWLQTTMQQ